MSFFFYQERDGSVSTDPREDAYMVPFMTREVAIVYGQVITKAFGGLYCVIERNESHNGTLTSPKPGSQGKGI